MKIDFNKEDVLVMVSADRRKGIYANSTMMRGSRTLRTAGQLPTTASSHTLQVVALVNSLRSISRKEATRLVEGTSRIKPAVVVGSQDKSFLQAINSIVASTGDGYRLRAGGNFIELLHNQLNRFTIITRSPDEGDKSLLVLGSWARQSIATPKIVAEIPDVLAPRVITQHV